MSIRKEKFAIGEYYHCYNRGVDKRNIFLDKDDFDYFLDIVEIFNQTESLGGMHVYRYPVNYRAMKNGEVSPLVSLMTYCLNKNHFHFLLYECTDGGISKFMQKIGTGYTMYCNNKYDRNGSLFQGKFKSSHIKSDMHLQQIGVYVNSNNLVHNISNGSLYRSSLKEYLKIPTDRKICDTIVILESHR